MMSGYDMLYFRSDLPVILDILLAYFIIFINCRPPNDVDIILISVTIEITIIPVTPASNMELNGDGKIAKG